MTEEDTHTITIDAGEAVTLDWDEDASGYVGVCPRCGGRLHLRSYDDGDGRWDDALECAACDWQFWI